MKNPHNDRLKKFAHTGECEHHKDDIETQEIVVDNRIKEQKICTICGKIFNHKFTWRKPKSEVKKDEL